MVLNPHLKSIIKKIHRCVIRICIVSIVIGAQLSFALPTIVSIQIETPDKNIPVMAEIAVTPEQQERGLMYRTELADNNGMIFIFEYKKIIAMWMKNTYIPLDMIFFDENGIITHIHKNAIPHDKTIISSQKPSIGVLEVNSGFTDKYHIRIGQKLIYTIN